MRALALITMLVNLPLGIYLGWWWQHNYGTAAPRPARRKKIKPALPQTPSEPVKETVPAAPSADESVEPIPVEAPVAVVPAAVEAPPLVPTQDLPSSWLELLEDAGEVRSFVEASVKVLKLEVGRYRDRLVMLEEESRQPQENAEAAAACLAQIEQANADWLVRQGEAVECLQQQREGMGCLAYVGQRLEDVLVNQTAQIESSISNLKQLDPIADPAGTRTHCVTELQRLLNLAHELRDVMADVMSAILGAEGRLSSLKSETLTDELTGVWNRTAEERKLWELFRDDPNHIRTVSFGLVDVDGLGRLNDKLGTLRADGVLAAVGRLLPSLVRNERGDDALFRHAGQRFGMFFGDTGPNAATSNVEKIRQTLESTTFHCEDNDYQLTMSCAVTDVRPGDTSEALLTRVERVVRSAKQAGRNCTMLDSGQGPVRVDPPTFKVKPRVIELG
ncbi:MAG: GGDEF domain-containing protein [Planctomycetia bacterium]|nr:GGDEF domain-containing protein [Planctomycetia bacterium]